MKTKKLFTSLSFLTLALGAFSFLLVGNNKTTKVVDAATYNQSVNDYYSNIDWDLTGSSLKSALATKIKIDKAGWSYDGLYEAYKTTDVRNDGIHLWDIYADSSDYTLNDKRINASYKKEGDSLNREHIIPQSSFNEAAPMKSDIHHVLPSDGYVNNRRGSYPHDDVVSGVTYTSNDGCKLGNNASGTKTFEPMPQYKGDIARIYFYFVTCYQHKMSSNSFSAFDQSTYPSIKEPYLSTYLKWAKEDPVSEKEINRNQAAYEGQGNRNPFIDCPYAVGAIWDSNHASDYGNKGEYTSGEGLTISKTNISLISGNSATLSASSTNSSNISWTTSNPSVASISSSSTSSGGNLTVTAGSAGTTTITAKATIGGTQYTKTCTVTVAATKQVASISISGQKTSYSVDDTFVKPTVTATYNDDTEAVVTNDATCTGYDMSVAGDYTVTVSYSYGGATKTATYDIKVKGSGGGGESGEEITLDISFTGSKSSDTDSEGNVWSTIGSYTTGSGYLRLNSLDTYISNSPALAVDTSETMSFSATLRTYGGVSNQSLRITAYNEDGDPISNTLILSPTSSTLTLYSGTLTFTNSTDHEVTIKAYSGNNNSLGISGMSLTYISWAESTKSLTDIDVQASPKTSYEVGDTFDPTGLVITRTYSDNSTDTYTYAGHTSEFSFDPSLVTPLAASDEVVEITYGGFSCFLPIVVSLPKELTSISISGYTTNFVEGDTFSYGGTVTAIYADTTSEDVTSSATFTGYNMTTVGNQTVTVSYSGKSQTYVITVSAGTLSSIAVTGMTTTYQKNYSFSFDGTCTATFANGYEKEVTPTSVSTPDLSSVGIKPVTVTYSYNGITKSTSYNITVNSCRVVMEASEAEGQITWPTSSTPSISGAVTGLSVSLSGRTQYESSSIRLGTGSGGGTLSISASISITKVKISAKYFSSSYSSSVLKVDGQSVSSLTSGYKDYTVTLFSAKTSFNILTESSSNRVNIQSVTLYANGPEVDIGQTEDCLGLETYINNYMHMDYTENLGYCSDSEHHYYATAKAAFNDLNDHQRSLFTSNSAYLAEWTRLSTWASKNGDSLSSSNNKLIITSIVDSTESFESNSALITIIAVSALSTCVLLSLLIIKKRRYRE